MSQARARVDWRRRFGWLLLITTVFWGAIWGGVKLVEEARAGRQLRMLTAGAGEMQRALEQYAVEHDGTYPPDLVELFLVGGMTRMPASPFGGELQILTERSNPIPGAVAYVATGPIVVIGAPEPNGEPPDIPIELDQYLLVVYGTSDRGAQPPVQNEISADGTTLATKPRLEWSRFAWDRVWVLVQSGEEPQTKFPR